MINHSFKVTGQKLNHHSIKLDFTSYISIQKIEFVIIYHINRGLLNTINRELFNFL